MSQAWVLLRADSSYIDFTQTQYAAALEWLTGLELLSGDLSLAPALVNLPDDQLHQVLFSHALEASSPSWLPDADILVADSSDMPHDAAALAAGLGLPQAVAMSAIREIHGRIDLEARARVGAAGELALVRLLEARWPESTIHVALTDDGFGYDIAFTLTENEWHLEVKTTKRRGRLVIYLSRHEYEVSLVDPYWRLVVVGLHDDDSPGVVATVEHERLLQRTPQEVHPEVSWQSVRLQVSTADLRPGLSFADVPFQSDESDVNSLLCSTSPPGAPFAWAPEARGGAGHVSVDQQPALPEPWHQSVHRRPD